MCINQLVREYIKTFDLKEGEENFLGFSMESILIVSSVNHLKSSDVLISGRREGVKQDAKMSLFFMSLLWGEGGGQGK